MKNLKRKILLAQSGDEQAMMDIISLFEPLTNKYFVLMHFDEDFKSEITMHLIELIYSMDFTKFRIINDGAIINFIKTSIYRKYILLSKFKNKIFDHEIFCEYDDSLSCCEDNYKFQSMLDELFIDEMLKCYLTNKEYICFNMMVVKGFSASQVSERLGLTRQAINNTKKRGIKRLKENIRESCAATRI